MNSADWSPWAWCAYFALLGLGSFLVGVAGLWTINRRTCSLAAWKVRPSAQQEVQELVGVLPSGIRMWRTVQPAPRRRRWLSFIRP